MTVAGNSPTHNNTDTSSTFQPPVCPSSLSSNQGLGFCGVLVRKGLITKANIGVSTLFQHEAAQFSSSSHTPAPHVSSPPLLSALFIFLNLTCMNCLTQRSILIRVCIRMCILIFFIHLQYVASVFI